MAWELVEAIMEHSPISLIVDSSSDHFFRQTNVKLKSSLWTKCFTLDDGLEVKNYGDYLLNVYRRKTLKEKYILPWHLQIHGISSHPKAAQVKNQCSRLPSKDTLWPIITIPGN